MCAATPRQPVLLNEAEAIIEAFWDEHLSPLAQYTLRNTRGPEQLASQPRAAARVSTVGDKPEAPPAFGPLPPDKARASQFWCFVTLAWDRPAGVSAGSRVALPLLAFDRALRVDLIGYNRLIMRAACPKHVSLTLVATVDGAEQTVFAGEPGRSSAHEFEGVVRGSVLEHLRLEVASSCDGADEVWLYWIGCAHTMRRKAMLARPSPFTSD